MVNPIYTEPDPESDLDPDIRGYSHRNQLSSISADQHQHHQVYPRIDSNPLSFVSEKPSDLGPAVHATLNASTGDNGLVNEKDYATPGLISTRTATTFNSETPDTALNPSPTAVNVNNNDASSAFSADHHDEEDDQDQRPAFPHITWKRSAIVSHPVPICFISCFCADSCRTQSRDAPSSAPHRSCSRSLGLSPTPASRTWPSSSLAC